MEIIEKPIAKFNKLKSHHLIRLLAIYMNNKKHLIQVMMTKKEKIKPILINFSMTKTMMVPL
jgi:hypothetical protein